VWISEQEVEEQLSIPTAVAAIADALSRPESSAPESLTKLLATWDGGSVHALGSIWPIEGYAGFKTWVNTPARAESIFTLFDTTAGRLVACIEARTLGRLRTAAVGAIGAQLMSPSDSSVLAIVGSGRQALPQALGVAAVLPLKTIYVWSPTPEHRAAFALEVERAVAVEVVAVDDAETALHSADVVVTVTRATEPCVTRALLRDDVHVNAMGAILPNSAELHGDVLDAAKWIVADDVESASRNSRELRELFDRDAGARNRIQPLSELLRAPSPKRPHGLTIFKSVGLGACDLALAVATYRATLETDA
jgi:ornithine cyclodeaminase